MERCFHAGLVMQNVMKTSSTRLWVSYPQKMCINVEKVGFPTGTDLQNMDNAVCINFMQIEIIHKGVVLKN